MTTEIEYEVLTPISRDNQDYVVGAPIFIPPKEAEELLKIKAIKLPTTEAADQAVGETAASLPGAIASTSDASGQVQALTAQLESGLQAYQELQSEFKLTKDQLESTSSDLASAKADLAAAQDANTALQASVAELQAKLDAAAAQAASATAGDADASANTASADATGKSTGKGTSSKQ